MSRNQAPPGCYLVILIIIFGSIFLYEACDYKFYKPEREAKKKAELINFWSEATLKYFDKLKCRELEYKSSELKISKCFIIESYLDNECKISKYTVSEFDTINKLEPILTRKIDEANVIIWISSFGGEIEGKYSDGSDAFRLFAEVKFIDKENETIFKKSIVKYNGTPLNSIKKLKDQPSSNVYYGDKPLQEIATLIIKQSH